MVASTSCGSSPRVVTRSRRTFTTPGAALERLEQPREPAQVHAGEVHLHRLLAQPRQLALGGGGAQVGHLDPERGAGLRDVAEELDGRPLQPRLHRLALGLLAPVALGELAHLRERPASSPRCAPRARETPRLIWSDTSQTVKSATAERATVTSRRSRGESFAEPRLHVGPELPEPVHLSPSRPRARRAGLEAGEPRVDGELELAVGGALARAAGARVAEAARGLAAPRRAGPRPRRCRWSPRRGACRG